MGAHETLHIIWEIVYELLLISQIMIRKYDRDTLNLLLVEIRLIK